MSASDPHPEGPGSGSGPSAGPPTSSATDRKHRGREHAGPRRGRVPLSGILLIILGLLFLGGTTGLLDTGRVLSNWWPAILIVIGLEQIVNAPRARASGFVLVVIGSILLAFTVGGMPWEYVGQFWPLILIGIGLMIILKPRRTRSRDDAEG